MQDNKTDLSFEEEVKLAKFESFIEKIRNELGCNQYGFTSEYVVSTLFGLKINHYATIINCIFAGDKVVYDNYDDVDIKTRITWLKAMVFRSKKKSVRLHVYSLH